MRDFYFFLIQGMGGGGGGPCLSPTKPLSNFLSNILKFITIFLSFFDLNIHSMKKDHLLDFSIQSLWGKT